MSEYIMISPFPNVADYRRLRVAAGLSPKAIELGCRGFSEFRDAKPPMEFERCPMTAILSSVSLRRTKGFAPVRISRRSMPQSFLCLGIVRKPLPFVCSLSSVRGAHLAHNVSDVDLYRALAHAKLVGDDLVCLAQL